MKRLLSVVKIVCNMHINTICVQITAVVTLSLAVSMLTTRLKQAAGWSTTSCAQPAKRTPPNTSRTKISNTQRTENKTTDVVIHQHSRKLLKMDILMSETCWAHNKWNKIASDIKLVFHSSTSGISVFFVMVTEGFTERFSFPPSLLYIETYHSALRPLKEVPRIDTIYFSIDSWLCPSPLVPRRVAQNRFARNFYVTNRVIWKRNPTGPPTRINIFVH